MHRHNQKHQACHHRRGQALMVQRKAQDQRVTGEERDYQRQKYPRAPKNSIVSCHGVHPLAAMAEITHRMGPRQVQTADH